MNTDQYIEISTIQGRLRGLVKISNGLSRKTYYSFQGIPYAKPPVGKLRFKAPQSYGHWEGVRDATKEGNDSIQKHMLFKHLIGDEDCLYLNVYTTEPENLDARKAVMVWIHGGGFAGGSGSSELYGPDFLIEQDIVLVTINYRCGVLGFLSLENDKLPGNMGLKDQTMALLWVQEYIDSFGGDPNNVTIFGKSAGGASAHYHLLSSLSRGLFHKAILQSGFSVCPWAFQNKPKEKALLFAKELGCTSEDPDEILEFLMTISAADIVETQEKESIPTEKEKVQAFCYIFGPCVETAGNAPFLPDYPRNLMEREEFSKVPIIMGVVDKEGVLALSKQQINYGRVNTNVSVMVPNNLNIIVGSESETELGKEILQFYTGQDTLSQDVLHGYHDFISDVAFVNGLEDSRQSFLKHMTTPVYNYQFTYVSPRALSASLLPKSYPDKAQEFVGTSHGDDLVYLFKTNMSQVPFVPPNPEDQEFITKLLKAWTNFAQTGNPNCKELGVIWKPDSIENPHYLDLGKVWTLMEGISFTKRMEFWKKLYKEYSYSY